MKYISIALLCMVITVMSVAIGWTLADIIFGDKDEPKADMREEQHG